MTHQKCKQQSDNHLNQPFVVQIVIEATLLFAKRSKKVQIWFWRKCLKFLQVLLIFETILLEYFKNISVWDCNILKTFFYIFSIVAVFKKKNYSKISIKDFYFLVPSRLKLYCWNTTLPHGFSPTLPGKIKLANHHLWVFNILFLFFSLFSLFFPFLSV